jgi:hypothetical protein
MCHKEACIPPKLCIAQRQTGIREKAGEDTWEYRKYSVDRQCRCLYRNWMRLVCVSLEVVAVGEWEVEVE